MEEIALTAAVTAAKPKLESWFNNIVEKMDVVYKTTLMKDRDHFMDYLERTYKRFSLIRPVGFREQLDFSKIYVPLTLENGNDKEYVVDSFPKDLVSKHKHLLIVDNAGMGKSTISKRMFMGAFEDGSCGIPIFVELRHLSKGHDVVSEILKQTRNLSSEFDGNLLRVLLEKGHFVIFLDGYDEISLSEKSVVTESLQTFIEKAANNVFVLTSRQDDALMGFQTFCQYSIKQLKDKDAYQLLSNLDNNGEKSQHLIRTLKQEKLDGVKEFLVNPLLVTLLYTAFDFEPTIPTKKHLFYDQVFNAFFQQHDFSKGDSFVHEKKSNLAKDDFERILRCIGFASVVNHKVEFSRPEIIKGIDLAKVKCGLKFESSDFLDDLILSVPIFIKEGSRYKWAHKSLSEYFAVEYIALDTMDKEQYYIENIYNKDPSQNRNLFDLYYDIKPSGFDQFLLLPCLEEIKGELLSQNENKEKIIFCTRWIGRKIIIHPNDMKEQDAQYEPFYWNVKIKKLLSDYNIMASTKPSKKWWTVLDILLNKKCLFRTYRRRNKTPNIEDVPYLKSYLLENTIIELESTNISQFNTDLIAELNQIIQWRAVYLTKEDCEKKIRQIKRDIKDKEDLSSWEF